MSFDSDISSTTFMFRGVTRTRLTSPATWYEWLEGVRTQGEEYWDHWTPTTTYDEKGAEKPRPDPITRPTKPDEYTPNLVIKPLSEAEFNAMSHTARYIRDVKLREATFFSQEAMRINQFQFNSYWIEDARYEKYAKANRAVCKYILETVPTHVAATLNDLGKRDAAVYLKYLATFYQEDTRRLKRLATNRYGAL